MSHRIVGAAFLFIYLTYAIPTWDSEMRGNTSWVWYALDVLVDFVVVSSFVVYWPWRGKK